MPGSSYKNHVSNRITIVSINYEKTADYVDLSECAYLTVLYRFHIQLLLPSGIKTNQ